METETVQKLDLHGGEMAKSWAHHTGPASFLVNLVAQEYKREMLPVSRICLQQMLVVTETASIPV